MPSPQVILSVLLAMCMIAGVLVAFLYSERQQRAVPPTPEPLVPAGAAAVLSVLRSSGVLLDDSDLVLKASAPAYALGLVRGDRLTVDGLIEMVAEVRRDGQIREAEFEIPDRSGSPSRHINARVAPLGARMILLLVEDRTRERLIEAVRRDFVANVSHELKTPIGAIRILAEAVQDASDDPEAVEHFAGRMITESERLTLLVQQIIELSRLQADDPLNEPHPIDVDDVVALALAHVRTDAESRNVEVVCTGETGLEALGDADQISMAVSNLVANAVTYSPDAARVLVTTRAADGWIEVAVTDQGIGIPSQEIDRIFERFYRVDPARHRSTGGTGLGLSIVKHVAATHGGDIRVWSVEGQGSTFTLVLPQKMQEERP
ncbi:ATP-binding protein [Nocardioides sp. AE5]|uniref:sensor histidine kinase n=1 Tax=Nocardioides sp. AE5 TaxID=2962573 RepID=UPI002880E18D|nr:ATP-binding protein [Nocardioides sp. AE5]MDT0200846.1 ATP-binding protein [Nocardioides sp. AE5]